MNKGLSPLDIELIKLVNLYLQSLVSGTTLNESHMEVDV